LPPVLYCRGTRPSQAPKSRPLSKASPVPIAATTAVEIMGPIAGFSPAEVVERLNGALASMQSDGTKQNILDKYR